MSLSPKLQDPGAEWNPVPLGQRRARDSRLMGADGRHCLPRTHLSLSPGAGRDAQESGSLWAGSWPHPVFELHPLAGHSPEVYSPLQNGRAISSLRAVFTKIAWDEPSKPGACDMAGALVTFSSLVSISHRCA